MKTFSIYYDAKQTERSLELLSKFFSDIYKYRFVVYNLVDTALKARYRRSVFGFLWSLLNPLFTMIILSIVFSTIYHLSFSDLGLYIMSGLLPWNLISNSLLGGASSLINAEAYLKKVYIPKQVFPIAVLGVETVNFVLSLASLFVLAIILGAKPNFSWLFLPIALLLVFFFLLGMVLFLSIVTVYFRDLAHILQIIITGLFYLTPIVYPISIIADQNLVRLISYNPFYYYIDLFHSIIKDANLPSYQTWIVCTALSVISCILGAYFFQRKGSDIIYRL